MTTPMAQAARAPWIWGPLSPLGVTIAALALIADQLCKLWMIYVYEITEKGKVALTPFFDLVIVWNEGISYGLFPQGSRFGQGVLIAIALVATAALLVWLARTTSTLTAVSRAVAPRSLMKLA